MDEKIDELGTKLAALESGGASVDPLTVIAAIRLLYEIVRELRKK